MIGKHARAFSMVANISRKSAEPRKPAVLDGDFPDGGEQHASANDLGRVIVGIVYPNSESLVCQRIVESVLCSAIGKIGQKQPNRALV